VKLRGPGIIKKRALTKELFFGRYERGVVIAVEWKPFLHLAQVLLPNQHGGIIVLVEAKE